ncbi:hypothetical protein [Nonomuraea deserti]|uniref:hypothetical protein n=1 Tax=Nonomuraea deserti TaxID=1848322 RepID=UPI0014054560|nr:hypothetical protein [Nonomuraea deserti]
MMRLLRLWELHASGAVEHRDQAEKGRAELRSSHQMQWVAFGAMEQWLALSIDRRHGRR